MAEEITELKSAVASGDKARTGEELGDALFSLSTSRVSWILAGSVGPTIDRFTRRFHYIETKLKEAGKSFDRSSLEEMILGRKRKVSKPGEKTSP